MSSLRAARGSPAAWPGKTGRRRPSRLPEQATASRPRANHPRPAPGPSRRTASPAREPFAARMGPTTMSTEASRQPDGLLAGEVGQTRAARRGRARRPTLGPSSVRAAPGMSSAASCRRRGTAWSSRGRPRPRGTAPAPPRPARCRGRHGDASGASRPLASGGLAGQQPTPAARPPHPAGRHRAAPRANDVPSERHGQGRHEGRHRQPQLEGGLGQHQGRRRVAPDGVAHEALGPRRGCGDGHVVRAPLVGREPTCGRRHEPEPRARSRTGPGARATRRPRAGADTRPSPAHRWGAWPRSRCAPVVGWVEADGVERRLGGAHGGRVTGRRPSRARSAGTTRTAATARSVARAREHRRRARA